MKPAPAHAARTRQRIQDETDDETGQRPPDPTPEPRVKDDGSVPEKQISRWKGEGGSWLPAD